MESKTYIEIIKEVREEYTENKTLYNDEKIILIDLINLALGRERVVEDDDYESFDSETEDDQEETAEE